MFVKTAECYDLVYSFKNYAEEANKIEGVIHRELPNAKTVLDVACGTGEHARFLANEFTVDGIDLQAEFVEIAQKKVPSGCFSVADMRSFDLGKRYDVVQCLFSSIGYLKSPQDVVDALTSFQKHLNPGGVIIVEPWLTPDVYHPGELHMAPPVDTPELKIVRMNLSERDGVLSRLRFHYLIGRKEGIEYMQEDHELVLYTVEQMISFFERAGLSVRHDRQGIFGRGLYIAKRV